MDPYPDTYPDTYVFILKCLIRIYCFADSFTTSVLTNVVDQHWFQLVTLRIRIQGFDDQKIYR
jgi:hypothetical protein